MGHPLRWFFPGTLYEVTTRTIQERFLLRPSPPVSEAIIGVIARAQRLYDVRIHAFSYPSNHGHDLVSAEHGEQCAAFFGYVNGNIARKIGRLHDWAGPFWGRRARMIPILDEDAQVDRLRYVMAQGVKEGLVASCRDWPGASTTSALLGNMRLRGRWVDHDRLRAKRRSRPDTPEEEFTSFPEVVLSPLPCWAHLDPDELRRKHTELADMIDDDARHERAGRGVVGVPAIMAHEPHHRPSQSARSPAPQCHTTSPSFRERFRAAYSAFVAAYREAAQAMREHLRASPERKPSSGAITLLDRFPAGSHPRPAWFVTGLHRQLADVLFDLGATGPPVPSFG